MQRFSQMLFLPLYAEDSSDHTPIAAVVIIVICVLLHLAYSGGNSAEEKVTSYCESSLSKETAESLRELGVNPTRGSLPESDHCRFVVSALFDGKAEQALKNTSADAALRRDAARLIQMSKRRLDVYGNRAFQPKQPSIIALVASGFFHSGWLHLVFNMLFLWIFGRLLESTIGSVELVATFIGATIVANLIYALATWLGFVEGLPTLGASAGIYGIFGAVWRKVPKIKIQSLFWMVWSVKMVPIPAIWIVAFYVGTDFLNLLISGMGGVNLIAHLAGFGFAMYIFNPSQPTIRKVA